LRVLRGIGQGGWRCAYCRGEVLEEGDEEEAWDGAEDCVEDEIV
jgi:ferredoxin